jgi:hypothetical protein
MKICNIVTAVVFVLTATQTTLAESIVTYYTFDADITDTTSAATQSAAGVTSADLAAGSGISRANFIGAPSFAFTGFDTANQSAADAITDHELFTFGFGVDSGSIVQATTLELSLDRSGTGPLSFVVSASINGGSSIPILSHNFINRDVNPDLAFERTDIDLSTLPELQSGDEVVFTLAAFATKRESGWVRFGSIGSNGDAPRSVRVNGIVMTVIPEPLAATAGLTSLAMIATRRR